MKCHKRDKEIKELGRPLCGGRGLKFDPLHKLPPHPVVSPPVRGAWVEIVIY